MKDAKELEGLNERKKYYQFVDDDTILTLTQYYKIDRKKELLRFIKDNCVKGDTFDES